MTVSLLTYDSRLPGTKLSACGLRLEEALCLKEVELGVCGSGGCGHADEAALIDDEAECMLVLKTKSALSACLCWDDRGECMDDGAVEEVVLVLVRAPPCIPGRWLEALDPGDGVGLKSL